MVRRTLLALAITAATVPASGGRVGGVVRHCAARSALLPRMSSPALPDALGSAARDALLRASDVVRASWPPLAAGRQLGREAQLQRDASDESASRWTALRRSALARVLALDRQAYLAMVGELAGRLPRSELPNRQGVPLSPGASAQAIVRADGAIDDCTLANVTYAESPLDVLLLRVFRACVRDEIGYASDQPAMAGLAEEGRTYMLRASEAEQQQMVVNVLRRLFTPVGPPFYRIFMSGIWGERRLGPWFWAPALTSCLLYTSPSPRD
mgnify:FL=1